MQRRYKIMIAVGLSLCLFAGCQKTPEESIVRKKGADSIRKYESVEEGSGSKQEGDGSQKERVGSLQESIGAPDHYANHAVYEDGALVIDTDADVIVPEVDMVNTYAVSAKEVNQEMIDTVTKAFFEKDKIYSGHSYNQWTKDQYQEDITRLKKYKAEGNLDPYGYGKDEDGDLYYNIDEMIARDEEEMKDAPDERIREEVTPAFGLEYWYGSGEERTEGIAENYFTGVAETDHGSYYYNIDYEWVPDISFKILKIREDLDMRMFSAWREGEYMLDSEGEGSMSEDTIKGFIEISLEEAKKLAEEQVAKLGWGLEVYNWDYALFYSGETGIRKDNVLDGGYLFHFSKFIDGVPITYTSSYGGALEDMDSTLEPWSYERCDVIVNEDGIQQVSIFNPYEVGEIQTEHVKMMDFDSIVKIYEQMMEVSNADVSEREKNRTYHIRKITLGYGRIYDPTTDNDTGLLVPVWDFFGQFDVEHEEYAFKISGEHSNQSNITINAIDGTVIDRELGY